VKRIVLFALIAQLIGTAIMAIRWVPDMGWGHGLYVSFFHAVSAFNNAGFSLFANNLMDYRDDPIISLTIPALLILGDRLHRHRRPGAQPPLAQAETAQQADAADDPALLLLGTLMFWLLEHNNPAPSATPLRSQWLAAFFQSATARTAGFNTVDIGQMVPASLLFMMMLMFIGAGATSTGGGIKVTTLPSCCWRPGRF
jgi:trk system potassium uptake protein TrkH